MFTILATAQNSQMSNNEATAAAMGGFAGLLMGEFLLIFCVILLVCLAFGIWLLWLIYDAAKAASPEHRTMEPPMVWLLLIPLWNLFWNFKALPAVSDSLSATLRDKGKGDDDAGRSVGQFFACTVVVVFILDFVAQGTQSQAVLQFNGFLALIGFILYITYVFKVRNAKSQIVGAG